MDSGPSDVALLLAVAKRDLGAVRTLYERHAGWLAFGHQPAAQSQRARGNELVKPGG